MREKHPIIALRSPLLLCETLKMKPTPLQQAIFENNSKIDRFVAKYDDRQELSRALAFCVLWQVLAVQGSKGTLIASDDTVARDVMGFLKTITLHTNQPLADLTNMPRWDTLQFGADTGWNIKLIKHDAEKAAKRGNVSKIALILGERSSEIDFVEASKALAGAMLAGKKRIFWLW